MAGLRQAQRGCEDSHGAVRLLRLLSFQAQWLRVGGEGLRVRGVKL